MKQAETRVLYVEDEALVAMVVAMSLEDAGFEVQLVSDGKEAIDVLEVGASNFQALVTDGSIQFPGGASARGGRLEDCSPFQHSRR